ncbi:cold-shock protein [Cupriavidus sp. H39]|uniref:cold-shock protein n=1 Tax=Cupriavidus sp. H39 TaxID=3401635 RepID=UPI003D02A558
MKKAGRVKTWHADKGSGFIDVHTDTKDVFFHVTALQTRTVTPKPGDRVGFEFGKGKDGRAQPLNVAIVVGAPKAAVGRKPLAGTRRCSGLGAHNRRRLCWLFPSTGRHC